jgi:hypothetical protein
MDSQRHSRLKFENMLLRSLAGVCACRGRDFRNAWETSLKRCSADRRREAAPGLSRSLQCTPPKESAHGIPQCDTPCSQCLTVVGPPSCAASTYLTARDGLQIVKACRSRSPTWLRSPSRSRAHKVLTG